MATTWRGSDLSLKYIGGWASWKMVEHYSQRRLDKARDDHKLYSPLALVYGADFGTFVPKSPAQTAQPIQSPGSIEYIIKLAGELGEAKERIKQLESIISNNGLKILARG
jgi:hypothetical protein